MGDEILHGEQVARVGTPACAQDEAYVAQMQGKPLFTPQYCLILFIVSGSTIYNIT